MKSFWYTTHWQTPVDNEVHRNSTCPLLPVEFVENQQQEFFSTLCKRLFYPSLLRLTNYVPPDCHSKILYREGMWARITPTSGAQVQCHIDYAHTPSHTTATSHMWHRTWEKVLFIATHADTRTYTQTYSHIYTRWNQRQPQRKWSEHMGHTNNEVNWLRLNILMHSPYNTTDKYYNKLFWNLWSEVQLDDVAYSTMGGHSRRLEVWSCSCTCVWMAVQQQQQQQGQRDVRHREAVSHF